jgi:hypothetical protein
VSGFTVTGKCQIWKHTHTHTHTHIHTHRHTHTHTHKTAGKNMHFVIVSMIIVSGPAMTAHGSLNLVNIIGKCQTWKKGVGG